MREFKIGEQVWWYFPPTANQKLKYPWTGPFEVTDVAKDRNTARIKGYRRDSWVHASLKMCSPHSPALAQFSAMVN